MNVSTAAIDYRLFVCLVARNDTRNGARILPHRGQKGKAFSAFAPEFDLFHPASVLDIVGTLVGLVSLDSVIISDCPIM